MQQINFQNLIEDLSATRPMAGDPLLIFLLIVLGVILSIVISFFSGIAWLIENYPRFTIPPLVSTVVGTLLSWILTGQVEVVIKFSIGGGIFGAILGTILEIIGDQ
jgi:uncharacterized membrane protein